MSKHLITMINSGDWINATKDCEWLNIRKSHEKTLVQIYQQCLLAFWPKHSNMYTLLGY